MSYFLITALPYDILEWIFEFFTINDINTINNLLLTSKAFSSPDPLNRLNLCVRQSMNIAENIINVFKETKGAHGKPFALPPPIDYVFRYEKWIHDSIKTARNKLDSQKFVWSEVYNALVGAYIVGQYQFIYQVLAYWNIPSRILWNTNIQSYHIWGVKGDAGVRWKDQFEGIFIIIIKIIMHVLQLTINVSNNSNVYLDDEMKDVCLQNLNFMLNKKYKTQTWSHSLPSHPGLYETMDDDHLYDMVVNVYHNEKKKLSKEQQEIISFHVFDNIDYEKIKRHCDNNTLNTYRCETLLRYIKTRQKWIRGHQTKTKTKKEMIKFITEYIA